jgi:hypothetical protein
MKILICGDSFAADWAVKYHNDLGWPNLLAEDHTIVNLAQAGCSEYKIYQQLISVEFSEFDQIIISHTSPYRIPIKKHPVHASDDLHKNSDLIYSDIKEHSKSNSKLLSIVDFFENYFDTNSAKFTHNLICEKIDKLTSIVPVLHMVHINYDDLYSFQNMLNFEYLFKTNRGLMNHYDNEGNLQIYRCIKNIIETR